MKRMLAIYHEWRAACHIDKMHRLRFGSPRREYHRTKYYHHLNRAIELYE